MCLCAHVTEVESCQIRREWMFLMLTDTAHLLSQRLSFGPAVTETAPFNTCCGHGNGTVTSSFAFLIISEVQTFWMFTAHLYSLAYWNSAFLRNFFLVEMLYIKNINPCHSSLNFVIVKYSTFKCARLPSPRVFCLTEEDRYNFSDAEYSLIIFRGFSWLKFLSLIHLEFIFWYSM